MTTLKTPVKLNRDDGQPDLYDADDRLLSLAQFVEVARRANLHEELVVKLKHVRHWVENAANRYYDGTQGAAIRQSAQEDLDALDDLLSRAEVKP